MTDVVRLVDMAASPTAVVRATTTWAEFPTLWARLLGDVWAFLRDPAGPVQTAGHNVMLYLDDVPHVEVGVQVSGPFAAAGRVDASALPAGCVATTVLQGPYEGLDGAHRDVLGWCATNGHDLTGARWEIYGDWHDDPALLETQVCYLLRS